MRKNILTLIITGILLLTLFGNIVNAESYSWQTVNIDETKQTVNHHTFVYFDDTSTGLLGRNKPIETTISYTVQNMPYNLTGYNGTVDYCNVSIQVFKNIYDSEGNLLNTTTTHESYYYSSNPSTTQEVTKELYDKDVLFVDAVCHYTNPDTLFLENILFARADIFLPSFECNRCEEFSLEELSNEIERTEEIIEEQTTIYSMIQNIIDFNYTVWLILIWIIKIGLLLVAITLIFYSGYFVYQQLKGVHERI